MVNVISSYSAKHFGSAKQLLDLPLGDNGALSTGPGFYPQILELHALLLLFVRDLLNSK